MTLAKTQTQTPQSIVPHVKHKVCAYPKLTVYCAANDDSPFHDCPSTQLVLRRILTTHSLMQYHPCQLHLCNLLCRFNLIRSYLKAVLVN